MPYALNKGRGLVHDEVLGDFPSLIAREIPIHAVDRLQHKTGLIIFKRVIPLPKKRTEPKGNLVIPKGLVKDGSNLNSSKK